jgi:predicted PurR-regulated permease PerM
MPENPAGPAPATSIPAAHERRWLRTDLILWLAALAVLLWIAGDVLLMVFAALLIAVGLDGLACGLARHSPLARGWSLAAVIVLTVTALGLLGMFVVPPFLEQLDQMWRSTAKLVEDLIERLQEFGLGQQVFGGGGEGDQLADAAGTVVEQVARATIAIFGALASLIVLIAIALFAAFDPQLYRGGLLKLFPVQYRDRLDETLSAIAHALRWWFLGQLVSMLLLGVTVSVGLLLIGVELWLGLGVLTALLTFIPFLGPLIAGIPIVIVGFTAGAEVGMIVLVFYLVVQNLEGNFIVPMIQHRAVHLAPALLISAQVLMGVLFGAVGLILAAPLTVVAMVAVKKLYMEDVLGEQAQT